MTHSFRVGRYSRESLVPGNLVFAQPKRSVLS
jgi:hypothetical protein